jgi:hypothetical protein
MVQGPYMESSFEPIGLAKDVVILDASNKRAENMAWTHRAEAGVDIYFLSNQLNEGREFDISLRVTGKVPEIWNPVTGEKYLTGSFSFENGYTQFHLELPAYGSAFVVLRKPTTKGIVKNIDDEFRVDTIKNSWTVTFDSTKGGPAKPVVFEKLTDWSTDENSAIKYYSGTAVYTTTFDNKVKMYAGQRFKLDVNKVANLAKVYVNGIDCGVVWTAPYQLDVSKAMRPGKNDIRIEVTNTWFNRLKGDLLLPEKERITWTNAPFWTKDKPLLPAGLLGPVEIISY